MWKCASSEEKLFVHQVVMGYVGDQTWSSPILIYNVSMVMCGLSVIAMPFLTNYWLLGFAAAIFGLFISANYALTSVIVVELVSLESFSKAYGLLLLIQGIANLIGPPLVGKHQWMYVIFIIPQEISVCCLYISSSELFIFALIPYKNVFNRNKKWYYCHLQYYCISVLWGMQFLPNIDTGLSHHLSAMCLWLTQTVWYKLASLIDPVVEAWVISWKYLWFLPSKLNGYRVFYVISFLWTRIKLTVPVSEEHYGGV